MLETLVVWTQHGDLLDMSGCWSIEKMCPRTAHESSVRKPFSEMLTLLCARTRRATVTSIHYFCHGWRLSCPSTTFTRNINKLFSFYDATFVKNDYKLPDHSFSFAKIGWPAESSNVNISGASFLRGVRNRASSGHNLSQTATVYYNCQSPD